MRRYVSATFPNDFARQLLGAFPGCSTFGTSTTGACCATIAFRTWPTRSSPSSDSSLNFTDDTLNVVCAGGVDAVTGAGLSKASNPQGRAPERSNEKYF
jgi:hypothetical protein